MDREPDQGDEREWQRYYERADRIRARFGDPFEKLIRRRESQRKLFRAGLRVLAVFAMVAVTCSALWILNNVNCDSAFKVRDE
jgi:hypothetical protein